MNKGKNKWMKDLINIKDIFENEKIVVMEVLFREQGEDNLELSVGIKDNKGDIVKIIIYH